MMVLSSLLRPGCCRGVLLSASVFLGLGWLPLAHTGTEKPPVFMVHAADGKDIAGLLNKVDKDWSLRLGGNSPALLAGKDWLAVRQTAVRLPALPRSAQLVLSGGDRVPLQSAAGVQLQAGQLVCQPAAPLTGLQQATLSVPLSHVAVLWLHAPTGVTDVGPVLRRLQTEQRDQDVVLLRNGDQIQGTVTALNSQTVCEIEGPQQKIKLPAERLAAVAFNTTLLARPRLREPHVHAVLSGGGRLTLLAAEIDAEKGHLVGKTIFRQSVQVPLCDVLALNMRQGRAVYLSDLTPAQYVHTPFLGVSWPWVRDGSVTGGELALTDGIHDKGIGLHSASQISYTLDGKYRWFEAIVDLDQHTGRAGDARIAVLVDEQPQKLDRNGQLSAGKAPLKLRVPVQGAKRLTLVVDYGARGDVQDHVNWADARLIP
jgi:hypothetical protein